MAGRVLQFDDIIAPDQLACMIAQKWQEWDTLRAIRKTAWKEIREYVYATDTTSTTNRKGPWSNSTTIPKVCQIRDNLTANYMAAIFPKRKWLYWEAQSDDSNSQAKRDAIRDYMMWAINQPGFRSEVIKLIADYIDYGDAFVMPDWIDQRQEQLTTIKTGYVGPALRRICPLDIVFNPTAPEFTTAPKIIRSVTSMGELKKELASMTQTEDRGFFESLYNYLRDLRMQATGLTSNLDPRDEFYRVDGFSNMRDYLQSDYVEVLTFYGDIYVRDEDKFYENAVIKIVDRHKVMSNMPNPSYFGYPPIFKTGWRVRQDNLWSMGPLDNLIGMQYRIDHVENLKADAFDLMAFPVQKIKGSVDDYTWGPNEKIRVGDDGDVELLMPPYQMLQANIEIQNYMSTMEEMAGSPKEAMGFRTPGEKTAYEVQRLENAAARIFNAKIVQFEEQLLEPALNGMLELARRNMPASGTAVSRFGDVLKYTEFITLSPEDITGAGRIKPIAARHFAEQAELIQNMTNFYGSAVAQDQLVRSHFSTLKLAALVEDALNLSDYDMVTPYVRVSEEADLQRLQNVAQEQIQSEAQTASGLTPEDYDFDTNPPQVQVQGSAGPGSTGPGPSSQGTES
jgi:hypothetical protein